MHEISLYHNKVIFKMCEYIYFICTKLLSMLHIQYVGVSSLRQFLKRQVSSFAVVWSRIVPSQEVVKVMYDHMAYITWIHIESNLYARCTVWHYEEIAVVHLRDAARAYFYYGMKEREGKANAHLQHLARNSKVITSHS